MAKAIDFTDQTWDSINRYFSYPDTFFPINLTAAGSYVLVWSYNLMHSGGNQIY